MATLRPFKALRPPASRAAETSAVPYDVVSTVEARQAAAGNPFSFLHVSRAEIDLAEGIDPYSDAVYRKASESYERLKLDCPLITEEIPSLYIYRLQMGDHVQTGIAGCFSIAEYDSGLIRKHERTRKDKEDDRTRHILTLGAQTGPVFLTYRDRAEIDGLVLRAMSPNPLYDFSAADAIRHTVWRVDNTTTARLVEEFRNAPRLYIGDGHHRAASASRASAKLESENTGAGDEHRYFLAVAFPAAQLQILPYNRVVKDLGEIGAGDFLKAVSGRLQVTEDAKPVPDGKGQISMYLNGRWYGLRSNGSTGNSRDRISSLDVSVLQEEVLDPVLDIRDVRTDKRVDFVGGIRGTIELERQVDEGKAFAAFSMHPVSVEDLMAIADADEIMPPKSTWFEPKLRDGLLIHQI
ncbi:MAG TPA: DUF1015 family protein [Blastocatellia bacterium]|nr:DUF1015 family protein [Blastocatellia bacterium]